MYHNANYMAGNYIRADDDGDNERPVVEIMDPTQIQEGIRDPSIYVFEEKMHFYLDILADDFCEKDKEGQIIIPNIEQSHEDTR